MAPVILVDAGPLVALLNRRERHHHWVVQTFGALSGPLITCEAVLTEACYLLKGWPEAVDSILQRVEEGLLQIEALAQDAAALRRLMRKYRDTPMSYADACLVRLSERFPSARLFTLDRDFTVYRRNARQRIAVVAPFGQG